MILKFRKRIENRVSKGYFYATFIAALFTIDTSWKQPKCLQMDEWIKMWSIHSVEYYSALKRRKF